MMGIDEIKRRIEELFLTNPDIHVNVSIARPKVHVENQAARIKGVYRNLFEIEAKGKRYSVKYVDILTNNLRIVELDQFENN